jgi:FtsP/CotA-like multicopper oxidase with cupredoxin domain
VFALRRDDVALRPIGRSMAATLETCYHRVGDGEAAPRRRRRLRICALLGATALGWCLLSTADKSPLQQEPEQPALREVTPTRAVRGWLNHTLTVEAGVWHLPRGISFHTRLYNGAAPSPVLWAAPGDRLRLTVRNRLGADVPAPDHALGSRQANTTNLHLHGVYDDAVHDNTFARVHPGEERTYEYLLSKASGSSLIYYHPHADGATALQSFGGMGGALGID